MTLLEFKAELITKLEKFDKPRPLICEGNPLECEIFIVGINAATEMEEDFWQFWKDDYGFNKSEWFESYIRERELKSLKSGKARGNKLSNTRQRIEWIVDEIKPFKTLETNLFVKATPTAKELKSEDRKPCVFDFLLQTIKPQIILIHGNEVIKNFNKFYNVNIKKGEILNIDILGTKTNVLAVNHLSRGWSKEKSYELGEFLKSKLIK
ncbi:hypothetical protein [Flavobacterium ardleyense]|uniref:hypothetical protein n=1 Tax=Flavobacterium ardleyense TaxID=2038737 RepID=UPI00298CD3F4|nr:hypothetical protein [Flavobacterium ardleyense]